MRGYTRGLMMNAVGPDIRRRLMHRMDKIGIDTAGLRSFLDPPHQRGKTTAGSGEVGYALQTRNHAKMKLTGPLRRGATNYVHQAKGRLPNLNFNLQTDFIGNRICISGRYNTHTLLFIYW